MVVVMVGPSPISKPFFTQMGKGVRPGELKRPSYMRFGKTPEMSTPTIFRKRAEYGFGEYGFKHRPQVYFALTELRGENSVSSSQPIICVPKWTHRVYRRTHRVCSWTQ